MSFAEDLRTAIDAHLSVYEAAAGIGPDAYFEDPSYHPMADGKYLQILAVLRRSNLLSLAQFQARTRKVFARLETSALPKFEGWCWGLGFSWRELPKTEPFLITSAIITRGLLDCHTDYPDSKNFTNLLVKAMQGLSGWVNKLHVTVDGAELPIPCYSPGICEPIYNAAAYACGTLTISGDIYESPHIHCRQILELIRSRRVEGLGWLYSPTNNVVDLLHQCYILNIMADTFGVPSIEAPTEEMVGQFACPCGFADVMRLVTQRDYPADMRNIRWIRTLAANRLEVLPKPARLWSLGELLVVVSRLGRSGEKAEGWSKLGRHVADFILRRLEAPNDSEAHYPRHIMHAIHGLTCYLALLRERNQINAVASSCSGLRV